MGKEKIKNWNEKSKEDYIKTLKPEQAFNLGVREWRLFGIFYFALFLVAFAGLLMMTVRINDLQSDTVSEEFAENLAEISCKTNGFGELISAKEYGGDKIQINCMNGLINADIKKGLIE